MPDQTYIHALIALAAVLILALAIWLFRRFPSRPSPAPPKSNQALLPFEDHDLTQHFISAIPNVTRQLALEVAVAEQTETFEQTDSWKLLWGAFDCGTNVASIQIPVTYRYHVQLNEIWNVIERNGSLFISCPSISASTPPAFDSSRQNARMIRGTFRRAPDRLMEQLHRSITPTLCAFANDPRRIDLVREAARASVAEFVEKCLQGTGRKYSRVEVRFADEQRQLPATRLLR